MAEGVPGHVTAVLLAAGESRRMGRLKALLDWKGVPLLIHQLQALIQAGASEVVVVLGHRAQELQTVLDAQETANFGSHFRWVVNEDYRGGKIGSLKVGLRAVSAGGAPGSILMLNVDQPRSTQTIKQVLDAHQLGVSRQNILFTIPTCQGRGGHPIVLEGALVQEILELSEDSHGLRTVRDRDWDRVQRVEMGKTELLWDVNTPEEFNRVMKDLNEN